MDGDGEERRVQVLRRSVVPRIPAQALVAASPKLMAAPLDDEEVVILHLETGRYYSLASVGAEVWKLIQIPRRVSDIVDAVVSVYDVEAGRCEADIQVLLDDMARERLIAIQPEVVG